MFMVYAVQVGGGAGHRNQRGIRPDRDDPALWYIQGTNNQLFTLTDLYVNINF